MLTLLKPGAGVNTITPIRPKLTLSASTIPSTHRRVIIVCKSEKRWTEHKFSRIEHVSGTNRFLFECINCSEERMYGFEG